MSIRTKFFLFALGLVLITIVPAIVYGTELSAQQRSLQGHDKIGVIIEKISHTELSGMGLSHARVSADIKARLAEKGVPVVKKDELPSLEGNPYLYILVKPIRVADFEHAVFLKVEFYQNVAVVDGKGRAKKDALLSAPTWNQELLSHVTRNDTRFIRNALQHLLTGFIDDYHLANPKEETVPDKPAA